MNRAENGKIQRNENRRNTKLSFNEKCHFRKLKT